MTSTTTLMAERPVPLKVRPELEALAIESAGRRRWRLKDPVSLEYFQLEDDEYGVLMMLDGRISLAEIKRRFERQFTPQHISLSQLQAYLAHLNAEGLALADTPDQGRQLLDRRRTAALRGLKAALVN